MKKIKNKNYLNLEHMKTTTTKQKGFKNNFKLFVFMGMLMLATIFSNTVSAQYTLQDDDVYIVDGIIQECYYDYEILDIIIPSTLQGQVVKGIVDASDAFSGVFGWKSLTSLVLPKTIEYIGDYSIRDNEFTTLDLSGCVNLVTIGNEAICRNPLESIDFTGCSSLTTIGGSAFRLCYLTEVDLTPCINLEYIGASAFRDNSITSIDLSKCNRLQTIAVNAFTTNPGLEGVILPDVFTEGYDLDYWEASTSDTEIWEMAAGDTITVTSALYKSIMKIADYSITYHADGGTYTNDTLYTINDSVIISAATKEGYEFLGWFDNAEFSGEPVTEIEVGSWGDIELWASFEAITYTITYNADGGTHSNPTDYTIESTIALANATKEGYTFLGWYDNADFTGDAVTEIAGSMGDLEFWAKWEVFIGVSENAISGINLFPNPVRNILMVDYNGQNVNKVVVLNVDGQQVYSNAKAGVSNTSIDFSDYEAGLYYVVVSTTDGNVLSQKVIKAE
jgi:uncharacterized repeat protein (TIGR02543 family)